MTGRLILQHPPFQHRHHEEEEEEEVAEAVVGHNINMMIGLRLDLGGSVGDVRHLLQWYYPDQYTYHLDEFWRGTDDDQWYVNGRSWRWSISRRSRYERG